jgi:hypothetical protein
MSDVNAKPEVKEVTIEAVVIRANGDREDLGTVAYWNRNPLLRVAYKLGQRIKKD